jgi:hypothetical protein
MTDDLRVKTRHIHSAVKRIISDRDDRIRHAKNNPITDVHHREELDKREREREEVTTLSEKINPKESSGLSGLYELCGECLAEMGLSKGMVTHKGASADSGVSQSIHS